MTLYDALRTLLAIDTTVTVETYLAQASVVIVEAIGADALDILLYDQSSASLIATSGQNSTVSRLQESIGLDRLALKDGGLAVAVFNNGESWLTGHRVTEASERRDIVIARHSLSSVLTRITVGNISSGVLDAYSSSAHKFTDFDKDFLEAAAHLIGLVLQREHSLDQPSKQSANGNNRPSRSAQHLTARELEVVVLVAQGMTNGQIAEQLVLVRGTVSNHIAGILRKLNIERRVQIAMWAVNHGLYSPTATE
jgi:DNA-binding CsgD family transcriptional regulator